MRASRRTGLADENYRSCLNRAYYAAYSKVTFALTAAPNVTFPAGREGPNHPGELGTGGIRRSIETSMPAMQQARRVWLSELIGRLYTLRIDADYKPSVRVNDGDAREAISIMQLVFDAFLKVRGSTMPTTAQQSEIVDRVKARLAHAEGEGVYLKVSGYKLDDEWLYIVVEPAKEGIRASDHANLMSRIERELRKDGIDQVLLVPALKD
jgi:hypothetical protein